MAFVSKEWLSDFVDIADDVTICDIAKSLVKVGLEEEEIHSSGVLGAIVKGCVISRKEFTASNGKQIGYCRVDVGNQNDQINDEANELQIGSRGIICGASNLKVGDTVAVALPGAVLPGDFEIATRKTYGHYSNGMICSERELGLGEDHNGIMRLQNTRFAEQITKVSLGDDIKNILELDKETLEINITPDRGYCFSYRGIAREYALSTGAEFIDPIVRLNDEVKKILEIDNSSKIARILDEHPINGNSGCKSFVVSLIKNIDKTAKTPQFIIDRLKSANMRSISLAVDVTNYTMLMFGSPLHAYDATKVNLPFIVRRAKENETIQTLETKKYELNTEDLLICDSKNAENADENFDTRAIGIAGVMGGLETEISSQTSDILLESAYFDPISIARTSRRHKISSEASKRFERGVDTDIMPASALFAAKLLEKYGNAKIEYIKQCKENGIDDIKIELVFDKCRSLLGVSCENLTNDIISDIIVKIGCVIVNKTISGILVKPPTWRPDLQIREDLFEEIARVFGYDNIPSKLSNCARINTKQLNKTERNILIRSLVSNSLVGRGFVEVLTYPFVENGSVKIKNPLANDKSYMRETLLQTTLDALSLNIRRGSEKSHVLKIFEIGKVFRAKNINGEIPFISGGSLPEKSALGNIAKLLPNQPNHVCAIISETKVSKNNSKKKENALWALIINEVKCLLNSLGVDDSKNDAIKIDIANFGTDKEMLDYTKAAYHPYRSADIIINGKIVGRAGQISSKLVKTHNLIGYTSAFELNIDKLSTLISNEPVKAKKILTSPAASEDYALKVDRSVRAQDVKNAIIIGIKQVNKNIDYNVKLYDEYHDESLKDKKSLTFKVILRQNKTFLDEEIKTIRESILKNAAAIGADLRL